MPSEIDACYKQNLIIVVIYLLIKYFYERR